MLSNLPTPVTSFIGRGRVIAEVKRLLANSRLLTLTGAGGSGKTRLAFQVGAEMLRDHADGVFAVELGPLSDPRLVAQTAASALGVLEHGGQSLTESLVQYLGRRYQPGGPEGRGRVDLSCPAAPASYCIRFSTGGGRSGSGSVNCEDA